MRAVAFVYALTWLGVAALQDRRHLHAPQYGMLIADVVGAAVLLILASRSHRRWLAFAAGFQVLGVANDLVSMIDVGIEPRIEITASYVWGYGALIAIAIGAIVDPRGRKPSTARDAPPA